MPAHLHGGYCYLCGADVHPDDLRECAGCGASACGECRTTDEAGDARCVVCQEDDIATMAIVMGEEGEG